MDSASFNPSKAKAIRSGSPPVSSAWPPDDERVERAVAAAVRCGAVGDKELLLMQSRPKSQWPTSLWGALGFVVPVKRPVDALVEVTANGTVHYITCDYDTDPQDGEEIVSYDAVWIDIRDARGAGSPKLLRHLVIDRRAGALGPIGLPPELPWKGSVERVRYSAWIQKIIQVDAAREIPVSIIGDGIEVGDGVITWSELAEGGGKYQPGDLSALWHGWPLNLPLTQELYAGGLRRGGDRRKVLAALLEQVDFLVTYGVADGFGRSAACVVEAAGETPDVLTDLALTLPWSRARQLQGPPELTRLLLENHPQTPRQTGLE